MITRFLTRFLTLFTGRRPADPFVEGVDVRETLPRSPSLERILALGWVLIALKSGFTVWADQRYGLPFHPGWLIWPSIAFGVLCTGLYLARLRR